jgi:hypoxanthine phosphoribosyltransferase
MKIHDIDFDIYISHAAILERVTQLAAEINANYLEKDPVFIGVLNGCFMFFSDLLKKVSIPCEASFIRVNSYENTNSTGKVQEILGLNIDLKNRHVILVEDIIDTGHTMDFLSKKIKELQPASVSLCTLLHKPVPFEYDYAIEYLGFEIENKFVIGYGLDYNEKGRNLNAIYIKREN